MGRSYIVIKPESELKSLHDEFGSKVSYHRLDTPIGPLDGFSGPGTSWKNVHIFVSVEDAQAAFNNRWSGE